MILSFIWIELGKKYAQERRKESDYEHFYIHVQSSRLKRQVRKAEDADSSRWKCTGELRIKRRTGCMI